MKILLILGLFLSSLQSAEIEMTEATHATLSRASTTGRMGLFISEPVEGLKTYPSQTIIEDRETIAIPVNNIERIGLIEEPLQRNNIRLIKASLITGGLILCGILGYEIHKHPFYLSSLTSPKEPTIHNLCTGCYCISNTDFSPVIPIPPREYSQLSEGQYLASVCSRACWQSLGIINGYGYPDHFYSHSNCIYPPLKS